MRLVLLRLAQIFTNIRTAVGNRSGASAELEPRGIELPAVRKELASRLSVLWKRLSVSFDKWAELHHLDGSTVNRYVNLRRRPPTWFITALLRDLQAAGLEISEQERERVWELHELLVPTTKQELQAELENVTAELQSFREREKNSSLELQEKQRRLDELDGELGALRKRLLAAESYEEEFAQHLLRFHRVEAERDALREQVDALRRALDYARQCTEHADAERRQLRRLLREAQQRVRDQDRISALVPDMESAPVDDLVNVVTSRSRQSPPIVTEVLRSVARLRPLADAVVVFAALHRTGTPEQAELALPGMVLGRTPYEICDLVEEFQRHRLERYTASAVIIAVQCLSGPELLSLTEHLRERNLVTPSEVVAAASLTRLPPAEAAQMLDALLSDEAMVAVADVGARTAATERQYDDLADLVQRLFGMGHHGHCRYMVESAGHHRDPRDVPALFSAFARHGLERLASDALDQLALHAAPQRLASLIAAFHSEGADGVRQTGGLNFSGPWRPGSRWWSPALIRPAQHIAAVIVALGTEHPHLSLSVDVLGQFLAQRAAADSRALIAAVDDASYYLLSRDLIERYTRTLDTGRVCALLRLLGSDFPRHTLSVVNSAAPRQTRRGMEEMLAAIPFTDGSVQAEASVFTPSTLTAVHALTALAQRKGYDDFTAAVRGSLPVRLRQPEMNAS